MLHFMFVVGYSLVVASAALVVFQCAYDPSRKPSVADRLRNLKLRQLRARIRLARGGYCSWRFYRRARYKE